MALWSTRKSAPASFPTRSAFWPKSVGNEPTTGPSTFKLPLIALREVKKGAVVYFGQSASILIYL